MHTEPMPEQIMVAVGLYAVLIVLYLLPSNAEIAARFRKWKAARRKLASTRTNKFARLH